MASERRTRFAENCPECGGEVTLLTKKIVPDGRGGYRRTVHYVVCDSMNCLDRVASPTEAQSGRLSNPS